MKELRTNVLCKSNNVILHNVGSLAYNKKCLEATAVVIWHYKNKIELNAP